MNKKTFGQRINNWLSEPKGEIFRNGKWKFWFPIVICFSILNSLLTAMVFSQGGNLQENMGAILAGVGAMLAWIALGLLHYSDSNDPRLARGVAILDSIALICMAAHFCFLMWVYGHLSTLQHAETDYKVEMAKYNESAKEIHAGNQKIADALRALAESEKERARIENDTVYQARKAAQAGAKIQAGRGSQSLGANLSTSPVELAKPPSPPSDSSSDYLTRWDSAIRLANFGELALAIFTLIFIRVRSSLTNAPREEEFPDEIDAGVVDQRSPSGRENFTRKKETAKRHGSFNSEGLEKLREALKDTSFRVRGYSFKSAVRGDAVWIYLMKANHGTQETVASAKATLEILNDAITMPRPAFRERLEKFLRENEFEIFADTVRR